MSDVRDDLLAAVEHLRWRAERAEAQVKAWEDKEVRRASCCAWNEERIQAVEALASHYEGLDATLSSGMVPAASVAQRIRAILSGDDK